MQSKSQVRWWLYLRMQLRELSCANWLIAPAEQIENSMLFE